MSEAHYKSHVDRIQRHKNISNFVSLLLFPHQPPTNSVFPVKVRLVSVFHADTSLKIVTVKSVARFSWLIVLVQTAA